MIVPALFLTVAPWLKTAIGGGMTSLIAAGLAMSVMAYSLYLSFRAQHCLDEVQLAGGQFAARWGMGIGAVAFAMLSMLPPFWDFAAALLRDAADDSGASRRIIILAVMFGFGGVVILQTIGMFVAKLMWWRARR